jgi:cell division ATPase FtsA
VAVLDMGIQSTDLVIYDGDSMLLAASVPVWGDHLTRDISMIFKVTYEDAECLKQEYGCALLGMTADSTLIEVPSPEGRPFARSPPQRTERNFGSARRGIVSVCALRVAPRGNGTAPL